MTHATADAPARGARNLAARLANARAARPGEPQERYSEGRAVRAECGELIPAARLAKAPGATRCVRCQGETVHGGRQ